MPNGKAKPLSLVQGHRTKAEIEVRSKAEKALATEEKIRASAAVRKNPAALRYYNRIKKILAGVKLDEAFYENVVSRYCLLLAEHDELVNARGKTSELLEALYQHKAEMDFLDFLARVKDIDDIARGQDRALAKKRDQLLSIEKENMLTIQGKMRAIPKKAEKKEVSGIAAYKQRREGG